MKLGVSLYSFTREFFHRVYTLEDCLKKASEIGYEGIEMLSSQMVPDYPFPKEDFYAQWHDWMEQYHLTPDCLSVFNEYMVLKTRKMTREEQAAQLVRDAKIASRLGMPVVRIMNLYTPDILELAVPAAEDLGVTYSLEVHGPNQLDGPVTWEYINKAISMNTKAISICPDISCYHHAVPPRMIKYYVGKGARNDIAEMARLAVLQGRTREQTMAVADAMGASKLDELMVRNFFQGCMSDWNAWYKLAPYITHIHAKAYDVPDGNTDSCTDCARIAKILKEIDYQHFVCTEYEAFQYDPWWFVSGDELARQVEMWNTLFEQA